MKRPVLVLVIVVGMTAGVMAGVMFKYVFRSAPMPMQAATLLSTPRKLPEFTLTGVEPARITRATLRGNWTLVFFGFTRCPDVCPTTLATLNRVVEKLQHERIAPPRILFISVDPMRDTPQKILEYVAFFNPEFMGATGDTLTLQNLTRTMSVAYEYRATAGGSDYTVDHTTAILLLNPGVEMHAIFSTPHRADAIAADLTRLIHETG